MDDFYDYTEWIQSLPPTPQFAEEWEKYLILDFWREAEDEDDDEEDEELVLPYIEWYDDDD